MHLNSSKCQVISFNRTRTQVNHQYHLDEQSLERVPEVKDLGVMLDVKLTFRRHMDRVISKSRSTLGLVKRFSKEFGDMNVAQTFYCSLVRPVAEYAAPVWTPYQSTHIDRIESIQKKFVLFALGRQRIQGRMRCYRTSTDCLSLGSIVYVTVVKPPAQFLCSIF